MARGHQKIQSQQKNAKKQAEIKKSKGHDQKTAAKAALVFTCAVCRVSGNYSRLFLPRLIIPKVANARSQDLQAAF
uniref:Zinc finger protein 706 n=1 Tax=Cyprinus carpio carpio TaxID=630221 RepID=A0A9J8AYL1_CYPCA